MLRATVTVRARRSGAPAPSSGATLVEEARLLGQGGYSIGEVMVVGANEVGRGARRPSQATDLRRADPILTVLLLCARAQDTVHGPSAHHVFQVITARANVIMRQMKMRGAALELLQHWTVRVVAQACPATSAACADRRALAC